LLDSLLQEIIMSAMPEDYGYVILTGVAAILMSFWKGFRVGGARKVHKVEYPEMYSKDSKTFNCIQRAHQNTLENMPTFFFLLAAAGFSYPRFAAAAGMTWVVGRIMYGLGYSSGDPKGRIPGAALSMLSLVVLVGCSVATAMQTIKM